MIVHVALQYTYSATNSTYTTSEAKCTEGNPSHLHSWSAAPVALPSPHLNHGPPQLEMEEHLL